MARGNTTSITHDNPGNNFTIFHRKLFDQIIWCIMFPKSTVVFAGMNCVNFTSETICICCSSHGFGPSRFDWKETGTPSAGASAGNLYAMFQIKTSKQKNLVSTSLVCLPSWPHNEKDSIGTPHSLEHQMLWLCSSMWDRPISSCRKWPGKIYWAVCPSLSLQDQVRKQISWSLASLRLQHITTLLQLFFQTISTKVWRQRRLKMIDWPDSHQPNAWSFKFDQIWARFVQTWSWSRRQVVVMNNC